MPGWRAGQALPWLRAAVIIGNESFSIEVFFMPTSKR
jgi:hypothetical protein